VQGGGKLGLKKTAGCEGRKRGTELPPSEGEPWRPIRGAQPQGRKMVQQKFVMLNFKRGVTRT